MMLLLGNLPGVRLIGLNLPSSVWPWYKVGRAFKGNATKCLRVWDLLNYDERQDQSTMFLSDLYEGWIWLAQKVALIMRCGL